jgi:hypothetical protein
VESGPDLAIIARDIAAGNLGESCSPEQLMPEKMAEMARFTLR